MTVHVELVSPERVLFSGEADMVVARTVGGGDIAFMEGHTPFVGALEIATATIVGGRRGGEEMVAVHGGFVEVTSEPAEAEAGAAGTEGSAAGGRTLVTILSDIAELASEIDIMRARRAHEAAEEKLRKQGDEEAEAELRRAHVRLAASGGL
jgi:F-type H+-transporting ATPase subunit epsilon